MLVETDTPDDCATDGSGEREQPINAAAATG
jgi:hypothetical protein